MTDRTSPEPAGFGKCRVCPYLTAGTASICYECASKTLEMVAGSRCGVCDRSLAEGEECRNAVCNWDDRYFGVAWAIARKTGALDKAIKALKYNGKTGWATIFGRVLVGYLDSQEDAFADVDLIVPSPGFGDRRHTELVIEAAAIEASRGPGRTWPFDSLDPPAIVKTAETPAFTGKKWKQRHEIAEGPLRGTLHVPRPERISGKRILVYDDVFTEGLTINAVARRLVKAGAQQVDEVVLARQPYRGGQ